MERNIKFKFNWILRNKIAIGTAPMNEDDTKILKDFGIISILSLCDIKEVNPPANLEEKFICKRFVLPDHTYDKKMNLEELKLVLDILGKLILDGPVFVHCKAAVERSPIVCMAWLIKEKKLNYQQALSYLMEVNKGTCPSKDQLELLKNIDK